MPSKDDADELPFGEAGFVEEMLDWLVNDSPRSAAIVDDCELPADKVKTALKQLYAKGLIGFRYCPKENSMTVQRRMKNGLWKDI